MFENLRRDFPKYTLYGQWYTHSGFWIVLIYRFGIWADSLPGKALQIPLGVLYQIIKLPFRSNHVFIFTGRRGGHIGAGLRLIHPTNVMIGRGVEIGEDCLIFNDVTLGMAGQRPGMPKIGNNVTIYPGARILGGVVIGDNAVIGANCVVMRDIPSNSVVLTPPCRIIPRSLSPVARAADQRATNTGQILG
jgi:serine O-acetyltransferase